MRRNFKVGDVVKHFKRETNSAYARDKTYLYQIISFAKHTETGEKMVVYKALYDNNDMNISIDEVFVRPYETFISEVDKKKYPNIKQKYRFEHYAVKSNKEVVESDNGYTKNEFLRLVEYLSKLEYRTEMVRRNFEDSTHELRKCFHYMFENALVEKRCCSLTNETCPELYAKELKSMGFEVTSFDGGYKIFW